MKTAKRSVSDAELRRYEAYAQQLQSSRGQFSNFRFNEGDNQQSGGQAAFGGNDDDDDLYN